MRLFVRILSALPLPVLYAIGGAAFGVTFHLLRWRRSVAAGNLRLAFPEKSEMERAAILKQSYRNLGELLAELVWGFGATPAAIRQRVTMEDPGQISERTRAGQSVLLLTAHFCNWEWQALAGDAVLSEPLFSIYKPQRSAVIDRFLLDARSRFGGTPIPHKKFVRELIRRRREAHVYAMIADQAPTIDEPKYWTRFLHQQTAFFVGADTIARALQATVLFVEMCRTRRGHYTMRLSVIAEPPYVRGSTLEVIERYARALEREIRASPPDWLWVHRRWKYPMPAPGS